VTERLYRIENWLFGVVTVVLVSVLAYSFVTTDKPCGRGEWYMWPKCGVGGNDDCGWNADACG
jgi:hypothetical protein